MVKNLPAKVGDIRNAGSIPGLGRSPGGGNSNPLQYACWRIPWTGEPGGLQSVGVTKSRTRLSNEHAHTGELLEGRGDFVI